MSPLKTIEPALPILDTLPGFLYQLQMSPDGVFRFLYVSAGIERILGIPIDKALADADAVLSLIHPEDIDRVIAESLQTAKEGKPWFGQFRIVSTSGKEMYFGANDASITTPDGHIVWTGYANDVTEKKELEGKVSMLARQDSLTGIPNRSSFYEILENTMQLALRKGERFAIMFIDLDHFKPVNDHYGHSIGDLLLRQVANRLIEVLRASDIVCRYGGDEFLVLLPGITNMDNVLNVAEKIIAAIEKPFLLQEHRAHISSSIGISVFPDHGSTADELIKRADQAMYQAKRTGTGRVRLYGQPG
ncbi:putative signaling protein [Methylophilaceae bacterium]|nr:putative signaling protein [Methylophilaceae bacterium]